MNIIKIKILSALCLGSATLLTCTSAPAFNENTQPELFNLVQRNCTQQDIILTNNLTSPAPTTTCTWLREPHNDDNNIQVSLHLANDVDFAVGHCTFTPTPVNQGEVDTISTVTGAKSASRTQSSGPTSMAPEYQLIQKDSATGKTNIVVIIRNFKAKNTLDPQGLYQANIIFNLAQSDSKYHVGDQINCSFAPIIPPAG